MSSRDSGGGSPPVSWDLVWAKYLNSSLLKKQSASVLLSLLLGSGGKLEVSTDR